MGFLSDIFSRSAIGDHGRELGRNFAKRLTKERVQDEKRVEAEFDMLAGNALGYQRKSNLGLFGKSHLVNCIQWVLIEEGFDRDFAHGIASRLAVKLASSG